MSDSSNFKDKSKKTLDILEQACQSGNIQVVKTIFCTSAYTFTVFNLNKYVDIACASEQLEIAKFMIERGADLNAGLESACREGCTELAEYMVRHGARTFDMGLRGACLGGNIELATWMISMGANNWEDSLCRACLGGNIDVVALILYHGREVITKWNAPFQYACRRGNIDIVNLILTESKFKVCIESAYTFAVENDTELALVLKPLIKNYRE